MTAGKTSPVDGATSNEHTNSRSRTRSPTWAVTGHPTPDWTHPTGERLDTWGVSFHTPRPPPADDQPAAEGEAA